MFKYFHNGNNKIGKFRKNVRLENDSTILYTDSLDFNSGSNIAYYFDGVIRLANPDRFNDPFDSQFNIKREELEVIRAFHSCFVMIFPNRISILK